MVHVPYKGSAPSVTALIAKEVDLSFGALSAFDAVIKDGRARALAVTTANARASSPDLPTVSESGVPGFDVDIWYGLIGAGQDAGRGHQEDERRPGPRHGRPGYAVEAPGRGLEPAYLDPAETGQLMRRDVARWREVTNRIQLSLD